VDGSTDILCSVKVSLQLHCYAYCLQLNSAVLHDTQLEISEPDPAAPDLGCLVVNIDISPSCDIYAEDKILQAEGTKIAGQLQRILSSSGGLDLKQFCILSGLYCWTVHVDLLVVLSYLLSVTICP
jgi:exosome complex RNA-binding protein Rrp42 (RNase PH superfamily)